MGPVPNSLLMDRYAVCTYLVTFVVFWVWHMHSVWVKIFHFWYCSVKYVDTFPWLKQKTVTLYQRSFTILNAPHTFILFNISYQETNMVIHKHMQMSNTNMATLKHMKMCGFMCLYICLVLCMDIIGRFFFIVLLNFNCINLGRNIIWCMVFSSWFTNNNWVLDHSALKHYFVYWLIAT